MLPCRVFKLTFALQSQGVDLILHTRPQCEKAALPLSRRRTKNAHSSQGNLVQVDVRPCGALLHQYMGGCHSRLPQDWDISIQETAERKRRQASEDDIGDPRGKVELGCSDCDEVSSSAGAALLLAGPPSGFICATANPQKVRITGSFMGTLCYYMSTSCSSPSSVSTGR